MTSARIDEPFEETFDVVVVGMGAAGSAAALAAHEAGARVLVLEKSDRGEAGGATRVSGGAWFINRDPARAEVYLRSLCGERPVSPTVVSTWARETAQNTSWLRGLGAEVAQCLAFGTWSEYPELEGSDCFGGMDSIGGELGNRRLIGFLTSALRERGIEIRYRTRAETLLRGPDGTVIGVEASGPAGASRLAATGGVVLGTGSFENDPAMVRDYLRLGNVVRWGHPGATGDGHKMAMAIGADLWHMDNMSTATGIRGEGDQGLLFLGGGGSGYLFVDALGRRFVNESATSRHGTALQHGRYVHFPTAPFHIVLDERMRSAGPLAATPESLPVGWPILEEGHVWSQDNAAEIDKGWILRADTLAELAEAMGVEAAVLERTVALFNESAESGVDDWFGRPAERMRPVDRAPFYAIASVPLLGWSNGGPRRDERSRVLDTHGAVIEGLYAAGSLSSTYSWSKDQGFHIADALAFGRVAGREAATNRSVEVLPST